MTTTKSTAEQRLALDVTVLFDLLDERTVGVDIDEIAAALNTSRRRAHRVLHELRAVLATEQVNVVVNPERVGAETRYVYRLTGDYEVSREWRVGRLIDALTRMGTIHSVMASIVNATDGRTLEGRAIRAIARQIIRVEEDIRDLTAIAP